LRGFFKNRDYEDASELNQHSIARLPAEAPQKTFRYDSRGIIAKEGNARLKNEKVLDEAGQLLQQNRFGLAVVTASETLGDSAQDRILTEARATAVRDYLDTHFQLDDKRIRTLGLGKSLRPGSSSEVRILVYSTGAPPAKSSTASKNQDSIPD
jgi:outer membrane protein OmpA-like peptidoglycan-associated protein